jgi:hypothetical protein
MSTYPDVKVQLVGTDGNVFSIIGKVSGAIRAKHGGEAAKTFSDAAFDCESYNHVLRFCMETVEVS